MTDPDTSALAIRLHPGDTVAVVLQAVAKGETVAIAGPGAPGSVIATGDIPRYHKIALAAKRPGDVMRRNAVAIGAAVLPIHAGDPVHTHNLVSLRARPANDGESE